MNQAPLFEELPCGTPGDGRDELDRYYTPRALARDLVDLLPIDSNDTVLEPSAGGGAFVVAAGRIVDPQLVSAIDIDPGAPGLDLAGTGEFGDFLAGPAGDPCTPDWIIGNPPYGDAEAHVRRALEVTGRHVAFLLRLAFLESQARAELWRRCPPRKVWVLQRRPSFNGQGTDSCAYGWFWWDLSHDGPTTLDWVP